MQFSNEDISKFLPQYLSDDSTANLRKELERFTKGVISRSLYTNCLAQEETIFQGDALEGMLVVKLPDAKVQPAKSIILSNTCDVDLNNQRFFESMIVYAPIIDFDKYEQTLIRNQVPSSKIRNHLTDIRQQIITQIFYLPAGGSLARDGIVFLDRICSCINSSVDRSDITSRRLFTLSDFGHYLFLFKLSLHFTRLTSKVDRGYL
jgi:hypothetical protein